MSRLLLLKAGGAGGGVLLASLVAFWELEEASGTRVDATGRGNDLTAVNAPGSAAGKVGSALSLVAASSQSCTRADNADLSVAGTSFTLAGWVQLASKGANRIAAAKIADAGTDSSLDYSLQFGSAADRFRFFVGDGVTPAGVVANNHGSPATGTFVFLVAWYDAAAQTINIQVNNGTADSASYTGTVQNGTDAFRMGGITGAHWDGLLDQVGLWKRTLTAAEKTFLYNAGAGRSYAEIAAYAG